VLVFLTIFLASYYWHGLGVTIGYHRLLAHRSFRCSKALEYLLVLGGYLGFQGSPIWWTSVHRVHHRHADTTGDIHSPKTGKFHAYMGWMMDDLDIRVEEVAGDLCKDPIYVFLDRIDERCKLAINIAFRVLLLVLFGWQVALASLLAGICVLQIPLLLNLFCHLPELGYKNFASTDNAVNVWWVAMLTAGEGWHNNHHVYPYSPRMGLARYEFDLSWLVILALKKIGLIYRLNPQPSLVQQEEQPHEASY
jgi:stearoyl-CoA desaturase (delta-9 desaturase)